MNSHRIVTVAGTVLFGALLLGVPDAAAAPGFGLAAWYRPGPRPGDARPAVLLAHVDSRGGPDVFHRLREPEPGNRVTVPRRDAVTTFDDASDSHLDNVIVHADRLV